MKKFTALVFLITALFPFAVVAQTSNGALIASSTSQNIAKVLPLTAGQLPIGQGAVSDPIAAILSGDCTMTAAGAVTCLKTNGVSFGTSAVINTGTSGATIPLLNASNTHGGTLNTFTGHIAGSASPPVLTSCGGSPTIVGDDKDGTVTMGTTATGCIITFATAYTGVPNCVVTWQATPLASQSYTISNTAITTVQTSTSSNKLNYHCAAQNGG
jgi:hypothetical protein